MQINEAIKLDEPGVNPNNSSDSPAEFPSESKPLDLTGITKELIKQLIQEEDDHSNKSDWDSIMKNGEDPEDPNDEEIKVIGEIEELIMRYGDKCINEDQLIVKVELTKLLKKYSEKEKKIAEDYFKLRISMCVADIKNLILEDSFKAGYESYKAFLSKLRRDITLRIPLNRNLYRILVLGLFNLFVELKENGALSEEELDVLSFNIRIYILGIKNKFEHPGNIIEALSRYTNKSFPNNYESKIPEPKGENGVKELSAFPELDNLPDIQPYKDEVTSLLSEIRAGLLDELYSYVNYKGYLALNSEVENTKEKEQYFIDYCEKQYNKFSSLKAKVGILYKKLLILQKKDKGIKKKTIEDFIKSFVKHTDNIWEKGIFPSILVYALLSFGEEKKVTRLD